MHTWEAVYRLDHEKVFTTDTQEFALDTTVLSEAAAVVEHRLGPNVTLIELKRIV